MAISYFTMWELDYEESWVPKNWWFWTVVLEKTLESPLGCKEIQPVHSKEDQPWMFFGRNDAKAETPVLWPPHVKSWLIGKDPDAGRDWGQEEKGTTEGVMAGWHHWLDGRESEWTPGVGDGQGGLACCDSWGHKESDTTEWQNSVTPGWWGKPCLDPIISTVYEKHWTESEKSISTLLLIVTYCVTIWNLFVFLRPSFMRTLIWIKSFQTVPRSILGLHKRGPSISHISKF